MDPISISISHFPFLIFPTFLTVFSNFQFLSNCNFFFGGLTYFLVDWETTHPSRRRIRLWIRCAGIIEDPKAHVMGLAYLSDSHLLGAAVLAAGFQPEDINMMVSLDHTIYFHQRPKADQWMLYCVESPWSGSERGLVIGKFFGQDGSLIATVVQEGVIRLSGNALGKL